jgi:hypothetical protein
LCGSDRVGSSGNVNVFAAATVGESGDTPCMAIGERGCVLDLLVGGSSPGLGLAAGPLDKSAPLVDQRCVETEPRGWSQRRDGIPGGVVAMASVALFGAERVTSFRCIPQVCACCFGRLGRVVALACRRLDLLERRDDLHATGTPSELTLHGLEIADHLRQRRRGPR